jgi:2-oxoglutarate ferredoxin oxidoreductase subunit gamma
MRVLIAGFGGQGILFTSRVLANIGLICGKEVSWLPSYGPEMRGGTCNCGVVISDTPIGSPVVDKPDAILVMNNPSLNKFESRVVEGGTIYPDNTLVTDPINRGDVKVLGLSATALADENGIGTFGSMVLLGRFLKETKLCTQEQLEKAVEASIPERKKDLLESNMKALALGLA